MKLFNQILALTLVTFAGFTSAQAATPANNIETLVKALAKITDSGVYTYKLQKGTTARALIEEAYMKENKISQLDEDFEFSENVDSIEYADGNGYGTATETATLNAIYGLLDASQPDLSKGDYNLITSQAETLLQKLSQEGAVFGYNAGGSGVCGVSYATIYVIDVKTKVIYELTFVSGAC
ncbi:MAG: hypothetical protein JSU04_12050 [Bdellovibrionales bacterium]|nr:hypothetical protein [Bdellovibrionales bacterium]